MSRWTRLLCLGAILASSFAAHGQTLTVLAAASLRESFTEIARSFERSHAGVHVRITFAGSQQLAAQILLDAPADVFASADQIQMKRVTDAGKATQSGILCSNRLVIAVSKSAAGRVHGIADLGQSGLRVVLAKSTVPAGTYADKVIAQLSSDQASRIKQNIRSREPDVRTVLARVTLGEADAGIVYATDVAVKPGAVTSVAIPERMQVPVAYVIGKVSRTRLAGLADEFIAATLSKPGQAVLKKHGFLPPPERRPRK